MIHEKALALAGDNAHLVARPRGVLHVYTGRLTPRAHVPRAARPMCRARTRQLAVVQVCSSLAAVGTSSTARRLCARCTACLTRDSRQTVHQLRTRLEYQAAHRRTTAHDVVFALRAAETPDEVDAAAHLTLVLFDYRATTVPNPATGRSLLDEVQAARTRVQRASVRPR